MLSVQLALRTLFEEKTQTIQTGLEAEENSSEHQPSYSVGETLSEFSPESEDQLAKIISKCKPTSSSGIRLLPVVLGCPDVLLSALVNIINSSLHSDFVPNPLKTVVIKPLLKKMDWT